MPESEATRPQLEPGSFRDPDSRVFRCDGRVLRLLSAQGLADWEMFSSSPLSEELVHEGKLVETHEVYDLEAPGEALGGDVAAVLEHEVVPFVSYPYEWTFGMLRNAALLQLELVRRAIGEGMMLKDSSPYNVQFCGARPVFIDLGSFERLREGEPWAAYRQFCMLFLYPLLLEAWKGVPFQPWLRGRIGGITPEECRAVLSGRDLLRRGALTHVALHARLERRHQESDADIRGELKAGRLSAAADRCQCRLARTARVEASLATEGLSVVGVRADDDLQRRRRRAEGAVRVPGGRLGAAAPRLGPRVQRRSLLANSRQDR